MAALCILPLSAFLVKLKASLNEGASLSAGCCSDAVKFPNIYVDMIFAV